MKRKALLRGALLGAATSLAVIGLLYLGDQAAGLPFVPFDIFDWVARALPGPIITFGIDLMVTIITALRLGDTSTTAKLAEQSMAIGQLVIGGAVFGAVLAALHERRPADTTTNGIIGGLILMAVTLLIVGSVGFGDAGATLSAIWLAVLFAAWGWALGWLVERADPALDKEAGAALTRRQFLSLAGGGSLVVAAVGLGLGRLFGRDDAVAEVEDMPMPEDDPFGASLTSGPAASPDPETLAARPAPVKGTRPELTHNDDFYRIDINTRAPVVDANDWRLEITGLVDSPLFLSLDEIRALPSQTQALTMQCISNRIGGDLTGTTRWTGVRLKEVLDRAGMKPEAAAIVISSTDGFFETIVMDDILDERSLLVYDMNGVPLPTEHGFPLRVYIPNRYGMKQPKWIETIEVVDEWVRGYWVVRGWSREAIAHTVSVVDTVAVGADAQGNQVVHVGGMAWAGERGISKVEVQADGGPWAEAQLIGPPLSPLSWVLWSYEWEYDQGSHTFSVRAYDGAGAMQTVEERPPRPNGATGLHTLRVRI
jgi:DMSO/TMAO reductase YedYZ molybdopterin-dependent catalytic subunit